MEKELITPVSQKRLVSLDAFRGFTMIMLTSWAFGLYNLKDLPHVGFIANQFTHHPWNGLYFWDLIQPLFMFIVGVAMPFSFAKRWERGETWNRTLLHVIRRSVTLFVLGLIIVCWSRRTLVWEPFDVLNHIAVAYFVAFLFMRKSIRWQIIISFVILLGYDLAYRIIPVPGVIEPWLKDNNLGVYIDKILLGKNIGGNWNSFNVISSSVQTMWGVIAGLVLKSSRPEYEKLKLITLGGIIGVVLGLLLDPITPIVARICSSSYTIESVGWSLLALAFFYWIVDIKGYRTWTKFMVIYGLSPIFIYSYSQLLGS